MSSVSLKGQPCGAWAGRGEWAGWETKTQGALHPYKTRDRTTKGSSRKHSPELRLAGALLLCSGKR